MVKHLPSGCDHTRDHEGGSVKRTRRKPHHWTALKMVSPVMVMDLREVQFLRRASVASEMISVHQNLRVIALAIEQRRTALHAAHQRIAVV